MKCPFTDLSRKGRIIGSSRFPGSEIVEQRSFTEIDIAEISVTATLLPFAALPVIPTIRLHFPIGPLCGIAHDFPPLIWNFFSENGCCIGVKCHTGKGPWIVDITIYSRLSVTSPSQLTSRFSERLIYSGIDEYPLGAITFGISANIFR